MEIQHIKNHSLILTKGIDMLLGYEKIVDKKNIQGAKQLLQNEKALKESDLTIDYHTTIQGLNEDKCEYCAALKSELRFYRSKVETLALQ